MILISKCSEYSSSVEILLRLLPGDQPDSTRVSIKRVIANTGVPLRLKIVSLRATKYLLQKNNYGIRNLRDESAWKS